MQTKSPHKLDTSKNFIFSPFQKQFYLPLSKKKKKTRFPHFIYFSRFLSRMTKTTQIKSKQKIYATKVKRKQKIKETNESSSIENRGNSPYEEQQLTLRKTKGKKKTFLPLIKIGKTIMFWEKQFWGKFRRWGKTKRNIS